MRHSASLKVTDDELKVLLDKLRALLSDPKELANRGKAKDAIKELDIVQKDNFIPSPEETESILKEDLRQRLASHYRDNLADIPISPISEDRDAKLSMIYVTPKIVKRSDTKIEDVTRYKDLFGPELQKNNIFLVGEPGMGKSTFSVNCAQEWSRQHLRKDTIETMQRDTNLFSDTDYMKSVEFLFHIQLRDAIELCDLNEIIKDQVVYQIYQPNDVNAGYALAQKVLENNNCIIIEDGLDEWNHPECKRCRCNGKGILPFCNSAIKANILITTRPWRLSQHRVKDSKIHKYLEINGVSHVHELVGNVLSVRNGETGTKSSEDFFTHVKQLNIENLLPLPIVTMQLVNMWFEDLTLSGSLIDIYASMMDMLFGKCSGRSVALIQLDKDQMPKCISIKENVMNKHTVFIKLCRLAFITLFSREENSAVVFKDITVNNELSPDEKMVSLKSGILTERKSKSHCSYSSHFSFIHKTFQEFLAAVHLFSNEDEYEKTVKSRIIGDAGGNVFDITQVFIFICGMQPDFGIKLSSWIEERTPKTSLEIVIENRFEFEIPRPDSRTIVSLQNLIVFGYREAKKNKVDIPLNLAHIDIFTFTDVATLKQLMRINKSRVKTLEIYDCKKTVSVEELQEVFTSSSESLTSVTLRNLDGQYDLSQCNRLKHLVILNTCNSTTFLKVDATNLTTCHLKNVSINVLGCTLTCTDRVRKLQVLILQHVKDMQLLCNKLPSMAELKKLYLGYIDLCKLHIIPPSSITHIVLRQVAMTAEALSQLVEVVKIIPHTVKCVIQECDVKPASDVEHIRLDVQDSNAFTLETYKWSENESGIECKKKVEKLDFFLTQMQNNDTIRNTNLRLNSLNIFMNI